MLVEQRRHVARLDVTSHERRQRCREVVSHRSIRPQPGELVLKIGMLDLIERHPTDVAQPVVTQRPHRRVFREAAGMPHDVATDDELTTVSSARDPRRLVDRDTDEPRPALSHLTDVQPHPHTDAAVRRPQLPFEPALRIQGSLERRGHRRERDEQPSPSLLCSTPDRAVADSLMIA